MGRRDLHNVTKPVVVSDLFMKCALSLREGEKCKAAGEFVEICRSG